MGSLETIKEQLKSNTIVSTARYCILGKNEYNADADINYSLLSWIKKVDSNPSYFEKFNAFKELMNLIDKSQLFSMVENICKTKENDQAKIEEAIGVYETLTTSPDYKDISARAKIHIPKEFGEPNSYRNDLLLERIQFFKTFYEKASVINDKLKEESLVDE